MAYTSLHLYRPGKPPQVSTMNVVQFLESFKLLKLSRDRGLFHLSLKYGKYIDSDVLPTHIIEPIHDYLGEIKEIQWDLDILRMKSLDQIINILTQSNQNIYRCRLGIGDVVKEVIDKLHRSGGDEPLYLDGWSFALGPVTSYDYQKAEDYVIGWIGLTLSGYGSLYPWKPKDIVERAERIPELEELRNLCRKTWPVEAKSPELRVQHLREQMGDLWPYETIDKPLDWFWGVG